HHHCIRRRCHACRRRISHRRCSTKGPACLRHRRNRRARPRWLCAIFGAAREAGGQIRWQVHAARGKMVELNGSLPKRLPVYVVDRMEKVSAWKNDPEQKDLTALRDKSSTFRSFAVEGCSECAAFKTQ